MWNKPNTKQIKQKAWSWIACDGPASGKRNGGYTYISPALSLARQNCPGLQVSMSGVRWKGTFQICSQTKTGRPTSGSNNNSHGLHNVSGWARLAESWSRAIRPLQDQQLDKECQVCLWDMCTSCQSLMESELLQNHGRKDCNYIMGYYTGHKVSYRAITWDPGGCETS